MCEVYYMLALLTNYHHWSLWSNQHLVGLKQVVLEATRLSYQRREEMLEVILLALEYCLLLQDAAQLHVLMFI